MPQTVEAASEITPPTLERVTFSNAGISDGTYDADSSNTDRIGASASEKLSGGLANKTFVGIIHFPTPANGEEWASVRIGGTASGAGVMLQNNKVDGTLTLSHVPATGLTAGFSSLSLDKDTAGVESLTGRDVEVKLSFEVVDLDSDGEKDDVRLWLYFDGNLYGEAPVVSATDYLQHIGEYIDVTTRSKNVNGVNYYSSVSVKSIATTEVTPPIYEEYTFSDGGINNGKYDADSSSTDRISGGASEKLAGGFANKTFVGIVQFPTPANGEEWASVRIGGTASGAGVMLQNNKVDGTLTLSHVPATGLTAGFSSLSLDKDTAGVESLTGRDVEVKLSFEVVDLDSDGEKDDVRLWLYFDGNLYGEAPVVSATDYLQHIGEYIGVTTRSKTVGDTTYYSSVTIRSEEWDDCIKVGDTQTGEVSLRVKNGEILPTGFVTDKYIISWSKDGETVTTYTTGDVCIPEYFDVDMLEVKQQEKYVEEGVKHSVRFISSVDEQVSKYNQVGFVVSKSNETPIIGGTNCVYQSTTTVYHSLCETIGEKNTMSTAPDIYGNDYSKYLYTLEVTNIPIQSELHVRAYVVLNDWTVVYGSAKSICVKDMKVPMETESVYTYSFDYIGGTDVMPISGFYGPYVSDETIDGVDTNYLRDDIFKSISDCGLNLIAQNIVDYATSPSDVISMLNLADKYKIGTTVRDSGVPHGSSALSLEDTEKRVQNYCNYPAFCGMLVVDEPCIDGFYYNAERTIDQYVTKNNNLVDLGIWTYTNMYPIYDMDDKEIYNTYLTEWLSKCKEEVLMWDHYLYSQSSLIIPEEVEYFYNLSVGRAYAQNAKIPFWTYVQAGDNWNDKKEWGKDTGDNDNPSEGEFLWNVNTCLAYGAKGISYFPIIQPVYFAYENAATDTTAATYDFERNGLIGANGKPTKWWSYAQTANKQIDAIDEVLMNCVSKGVIINGTEATVHNAQSECVLSGTSWRELSSVSGDVMIGCFNYYGKSAFYVVNYDRENSQEIGLQFSSDYYFRVTQNAATSYQSGTSLTLSMTPGEGVLIVMN